MQDRESRRWTFDAIPRAYLEARPRYPDSLVDDLVALAGRGPDTVALEVAPGPGIATRQFADRGITILAVELGPHLAETARNYLRAFPKVTVETRDFNAWTPPRERFDLIYAGQAWHWMDPETAFQKAYDALRPGGVFAPFWNYSDGVAELLQPAYETFAPELIVQRPVPPLDDQIETRVQEFLAAGVFEHVEVRRYPWTMRRSAEAYVRLIGTYSDHLRLAQEKRDALYAGIREIIDGRGGTIERPTVAVAFVCRRD